MHERYDGRDLVLPDDPTVVLRASENPALAAQIGHDIVTASGLTLLGADDKAGVAEIVTAAEYLMRAPEIPHGAIRIAFTPDEEIGRGADHFDVARFGAVCAYTLDGGARGELEYESFSADAMTLDVRRVQHPSRAMRRDGWSMRSGWRRASSIGCRPTELSPETTEGYEGFVHPYQLEASVDRTRVKVLIRDFVTAALAEKEALVERLAREVVAATPGATLEIRVEESYRNMREVLDHHPAGRRARPRGDPARRDRADREADPRRHRRLAPVVHGAADAESLRRRAQLPLAARVGVGAGHGEGGGGDRESGARVGGARAVLSQRQLPTPKENRSNHEVDDDRFSHVARRLTPLCAALPLGVGVGRWELTAIAIAA